MEDLRRIAFHASKAGVTADRYIIATDAVDETAYYRALAQELALPFTTHGRVSEKARYPESIQSGIAPIAAPARGFLVAPSGVALIKLLQERRVQGSAVITTPSALRRAVFRAKAGAIAHQASNALPERSLDLSSRDGWLWRQMIGFCLVIFVLVVSTGFGWRTPLIGLSIAASPLFLGMIVTRLAACLLQSSVEPDSSCRRAKDADLPSYTVIAALYRERAVVHKLIAALCKLDYPREKLDILIAVEADDYPTQAVLAGMNLPAHMAIIVAPPGYPRTKPRALNVALPLARGDLTVVYDAEDEPDAQQLRLAAAIFLKSPADVACLQARLTIDNTRDTWLTRLFTIEYAALFDVFNPGLATIGSPIPLGGTSNHFRTKTLRAIGGWDAWNVTEDADLGIRLARLGYRVMDLPSSTLEEAPRTLSVWMGQRTRWMKGFIQTCIGHSRYPLRTFRQLGLWRAYGAMMVTLGTVLSALGYPFFTGFALFLWLDEATPGWSEVWRAFSLTLLVLGGAAIYLPAITGLCRRRLWALLPWSLLLPFYCLLISAAAWRGLWELIWTPFRWNKTRHGLARTTRQPSLQKHQARAAKTISLKTAPP